MSKRASVAKLSILIQVYHVLPTPHHMLSFDSCYLPSASGFPQLVDLREQDSLENEQVLSHPSAQFPSFNLELKCMHTMAVVI